MSNYHWWQTGIIYQVYPRSFQDSNGDGVGDLNGIEERLDYLDWLGVDAVWISPIYPSPMADFGYDISDYRDIHPTFGTMEDFDRLLTAAHARDLKVILDLVPNHTSDQHPWFQESRASRDNPKRDWYIWKDPAPDGGPPNNWRSVFGGSGWTYDEATDQYYYHAFLEKQPDLNWRNPEVREAMYDIMRFWLEKGVDGFRVDVMWHMIKDDQFRDNPPNPDYRPDQPEHARLIPAYSEDHPEVQEVVEEMRSVVDEYGARVLIGEIYLPIDRLVAYYGYESSGAHLPFNFQLITLPWDARRIHGAINEYEGALPPDGWPNWVLGNHDKPRIASRVGEDQARVAAMLLLTLRGTPTMYYGDEIGMQNVEIPTAQIQDPRALNEPDIDVGRDPYRTPMQWTDEPTAGFTSGTPWLPVAEDSRWRNVKDQREDPTSILSLYRALIRLRKSEPALAVGTYVPVEATESLLSFERVHEGRRLLVALNFSSTSQTLDVRSSLGQVLCSTHLDRADKPAQMPLSLRPDEGVIAEIQPG